MPFNLRIPLGPIVYNRRLGGRRRAPGEHGVLWWLVIGWWWMPCWWLLLLMWWCCRTAWRALDRLTAEAWAGRRPR